MNNPPKRDLKIKVNCFIEFILVWTNRMRKMASQKYIHSRKIRKTRRGKVITTRSSKIREGKSYLYPICLVYNL